jgi:uroporphyrinogen-III decarboxylase
MGREPMTPPPHFDVGVGNDVKAAFLGKPILTLKDHVQFWAEAGLCLYPVSVGLVQFGGKLTTTGQKTAHAHYSLYREDDVELQKQWGDRLCLLGHIDVDLLARGTPRQVREQTRKNLDALARDGGYCPGSGNSVPDYVPLQNFIAMIEAIREWR